MLLAGPLSRLCAPEDGFYDVALPGKISVLLQNLPQQVAECNAMRVSANKDTAAVARIVQKWRKATNPISQGKLSSYPLNLAQSNENVLIKLKSECNVINDKVEKMDAIIK